MSWYLFSYECLLGFHYSKLTIRYLLERIKRNMDFGWKQEFYTFCFIFYYCFDCLLNFISTPSIPTFHKTINLVPEKYINPPSYCRSYLCTDRFMKSNFKNKHLHEQKDGFKNKKKIKKKSEMDLFLLNNYKNKNIPRGTRFIFLHFSDTYHYIK